MKRYVRVLGIIVLLAGGIAGWALFRPERLWVDARVNESFPPAASPMTAGSPAPIAGVLAVNEHEVVPSREPAHGWLVA